jgi:hypothetical protein
LNNININSGIRNIYIGKLARICAAPTFERVGIGEIDEFAGYSRNNYS